MFILSTRPFFGMEEINDLHGPNREVMLTVRKLRPYGSYSTPVRGECSPGETGYLAVPTLALPGPVGSWVSGSTFIQGREKGAQLLETGSVAVGLFSRADQLLDLLTHFRGKQPNVLLLLVLEGCRGSPPAAAMGWRKAVLELAFSAGPPSALVEFSPLPPKQVQPALGDLWVSGQP